MVRGGRRMVEKPEAGQGAVPNATTPSVGLIVT